MPPNICFTTTIAITPPNTEISGLMVTGRFKASRIPGDNAAQIPYGLAPFHHTAAYVFAENAGGNTGEDYHHGPEAKRV